MYFISFLFWDRIIKSLNMQTVHLFGCRTVNALSIVVIMQQRFYGTLLDSKLRSIHQLTLSLIISRMIQYPKTRRWNVPLRWDRSLSYSRVCIHFPQFFHPFLETFCINFSTPIDTENGYFYHTLLSRIYANTRNTRSIVNYQTAIFAKTRIWPNNRDLHGVKCLQVD